jgi:hypothetical protein
VKESSVDSVDELVLLRGTVESWADRAASALLGFIREDGSFWKDSKTASLSLHDAAPHITTSARAYIALLYADRRADTSKGKKTPDWVASFRKFLEKPLIGRTEHHFYEAKHQIKRGEPRDKYEVNTFDIAHLTDFFQVAKYLARFHGTDLDAATLFQPPDDPVKTAFKFKEDESAEEVARKKEFPPKSFDHLDPTAAIKGRLLQALRDAVQNPAGGFPGEVRFEEGQPVHIITLRRCTPFVRSMFLMR